MLEPIVPVVPNSRLTPRGRSDADIYKRFHSREPLDRLARLLGRTAFSGQEAFLQLLVMSDCVRALKTRENDIYYFAALRDTGITFFGQSPSRPNFDAILDEVCDGLFQMPSR